MCNRKQDVHVISSFPKIFNMSLVCLFVFVLLWLQVAQWIVPGCLSLPLCLGAYRRSALTRWISAGYLWTCKDEIVWRPEMMKCKALLPTEHKWVLRKATLEQNLPNNKPQKNERCCPLEVFGPIFCHRLLLYHLLVFASSCPYRSAKSACYISNGMSQATTQKQQQHRDIAKHQVSNQVELYRAPRPLMICNFLNLRNCAVFCLCCDGLWWMNRWFGIRMTDSTGSKSMRTPSHNYTRSYECLQSLFWHA